MRCNLVYGIPALKKLRYPFFGCQEVLESFWRSTHRPSIFDARFVGSPDLSHKSRRLTRLRSACSSKSRSAQLNFRFVASSCKHSSVNRRWAPHAHPCLDPALGIAGGCFRNSGRWSKGPSSRNRDAGCLEVSE